MAQIEVIEAQLQDGQVVPSISCEAIADKVIGGGDVVILKSVFDREPLIRFRDRVFQWGIATELTNPKSPTVSYHRIDENPPLSKTNRILHGYSFLFDENNQAILGEHGDAVLIEEIGRYSDALISLQNRIAGTSGGYAPDASGQYMRPHVIHYPSGGGFGGVHEHPPEPQRIGLILTMSDTGVDCQTGGTRFKPEDTWLDAEEYQEMGDICIFKYNIPHDISIVDESEKLDWSSRRGRWTMIMPYY